MKKQLTPAQMSATMTEAEIIALITTHADANIEEPWAVYQVDLLHNSAAGKTDGQRSTVSARIKFRDKREPLPERGGPDDR